MPVACFRTCHVALSKAEAAVEMEVSEFRHHITLKGCNSEESQGTAGAAGLSKKVQTGKANCCTLLRRITNSKMSIQNSSLSTLTPQRRLPHKALWHHVGATIGITLDKNGSLYDPSGTES